jgi:hypothetical protein
MIKNWLYTPLVSYCPFYLQAKTKGDLLECGCCFDNEVMLEDMAACNEGHLFCKECVRK